MEEMPMNMVGAALWVSKGAGGSRRLVRGAPQQLQLLQR
jgi:hypothetical protein